MVTVTRHPLISFLQQHTPLRCSISSQYFHTDSILVIKDSVLVNRQNPALVVPLIGNKLNFNKSRHWMATESFAPEVNIWLEMFLQTTWNGSESQTVWFLYRVLRTGLTLGYTKFTTSSQTEPKDLC